MSDYLDPDNEELLKDFFAEANGQVETLEQSVLVLENDPGNHDAIDEIFRAAHTLKGGAATVEMTELAEFTHLVEDVLDGIRSGEASVTEALIDALLASIDVIKAMLDARASSSVYRGDISGLKSTLGSFLPVAAAGRAGSAPASAAGRPVSAAASAAATAQAAAVSAAHSEYELLELREAAGPSRRIFVAKVRFNPDNIMKTVSAIHVFAALRDVATVLKTVPDFERLYEDAFYPEVEYFVAVDGDREEVRRKAMVPDVVVGLDMSELLAEGAVKQPPAAEQKPGAAQGPAPRGRTPSGAPEARA
ncbi:MAG: Hpt domain-containing protein, partial [Treponema sp.]|nr:Hpt domain-containing protein [Treponema sp.]